MRKDADITNLIHNHFTQKGIPILSVHDSYIIDVHHLEELLSTMAQASREVTGQALRCGVQVPGFGPFQDVPQGDLRDHISSLVLEVCAREEAACQRYIDRMR